MARDQCRQTRHTGAIDFYVWIPEIFDYLIISQGYLQIDDTLVKGKSVEGLLTLDVAPRVYLGGLPDMSEVMERSGAGPEAEASLARYRGCMRSLYINEAS